MYKAIYSRLSFRKIQKDTLEKFYGVQSLSGILYLSLLTPFISQDSYATLF